MFSLNLGMKYSNHRFISVQDLQNEKKLAIFLYRYRVRSNRMFS